MDSRTAVVVVSYNTRDVLRDCLQSVRAAAPREVIVVDNGSTDGSVEMVRSEYPEARLIASENRGYGAAANTGIRASTADYALLLNSDTILRPASVRAIETYLDAHREVGLLGPRIVNPDGSLQRSCFPFPTPVTALLGETGLGYFIRFIPVVRDRYPRTWKHDEVRPMPWVLGAVLAIRRRAFEAVAGFDESFFMYFEETDLCYRLWRAGWEVHFAPVTEIVHLGGASTRQYAAAMRLQFYRSMGHFYARHYPPSKLRALERILRTKAVVRAGVAWSRRALSSSERARARFEEELGMWTTLARDCRRGLATGERAMPGSRTEGVRG